VLLRRAREGKVGTAKTRLRLLLALFTLALAACSATKCRDDSECDKGQLCFWDQVQTCSESPLVVVVLAGHCKTFQGIVEGCGFGPQVSCPAGCAQCASTCICEACPPSGDKVSWCSPRGPVPADQAGLGDVFPCVAPFVCGREADGGACCDLGSASTTYGDYCDSWPDAGAH
jgi:hypothetical protein